MGERLNTQPVYETPLYETPKLMEAGDFAGSPLIRGVTFVQGLRLLLLGPRGGMGDDLRTPARQ